MINYRKKGDKYIFEKDGVYFSLTMEQIRDMVVHCQDIIYAEYPHLKEQKENIGIPLYF